MPESKTLISPARGEHPSRTLRPSFMRTKAVDVSIATSGYCQARCSGCIWPYMAGSNKVMTNEEFEQLLARFDGYDFGEICFNVINEPFVDKDVGEKIRVAAKSNRQIGAIFFSSNWLIPSPQQIERFAEIVVEASRRSNVGNVSLNATVSGIDAETYDVLQGGRDLAGAVARYRPLDFHHAVENVLLLLKALAARMCSDPIRMHIKAYGDLFEHRDLESFWAERMRSAGLSDFAAQHVRVMMNHGYTTFARDAARPQSAPGVCAVSWVDSRLVIAENGDVGLCCEEGIREIRMGNLLQHTLDEIVAAPPFQEQLAIVTGARIAAAGHACLSCDRFKIDDPMLAT